LLGCGLGLVAGGIFAGALLLLFVVMRLGGWPRDRGAPESASLARRDDTGKPAGKLGDKPAEKPPEGPGVDPVKPAAAPKVPADSPVKAPPKGVVPVAPAEELPPVGPTKRPPGDTVAVKAKLARAAYHKEVNVADNVLLTAVRLKQDEINKSNASDPKKPAGPTNGLNPFAPNGGRPMPNEFQRFYQGGGLPTGQAFQPAIADYWKALDAAAKKLGEAADEGLAAYEKQGVKDEAKLRPLRAMQLAGQHPDFLGIWTHDLGNARDMTWVIDFDERTGGFQVEGLDRQAGAGVVHGVYHGEDVQFTKSGDLSLTVVSMHASTGKPGSDRVPITMTLKEGALQYKLPNANAVVLERTQKFENKRNVIYYMNKAGNNGLGHAEAASRAPDEVVGKLDLTDANAVWRCQAQLASFAYYGSQNSDPLPHEALYIPYRSSHLTVTPGAYGGLTEMLLGRGPGAGVNQDRTEVLLSAYDKLAEASHPFLKRTTAQELSLCRTRLRLALADEQYGNTPASSIRQFQQTVVIPYVQYALQRDADRAELQESLEREHPG
jgi:hypothetical protein